MQKNYGGSVDKYMCTGLCPCEIEHQEKFKEALKTPFEYTNSPVGFRVYDVASLDADQTKALYGDKGGSANYAEVLQW